MDTDVLVIGAGVVGAALAYGIAKQGRRVIVLDGEDRDLRAARANFGLVWVQGKGSDAPAYDVLTRQSSDLWPDFHRELADISGMPVDYSRPGGLVYCLGDTEFQHQAALHQRLGDRNGHSDTRMVERAELERMLPAARLGQEVVGASFCERDGHVNPLQLLAALHRAIIAVGGQLIYRNSVKAITPGSDGFMVTSTQGSFHAQRVIVAAGLATPALTEPLGFSMPMRSERGQLLVTERLEPILPYPGSGLRQTADGTIMIGATKEDTADRSVSVASATKLALRATRILPALASARLIRQWSGFRVLPLDGVPIYAESQNHPGLFAAACHSGVTLAAAHAAIVGPAMLEGRLAADLFAFSNGRFDVQKCA